MLIYETKYFFQKPKTGRHPAADRSGELEPKRN
jgi:hypothetical protein